MPCLKDLHCFIELSASHQRLQEFGTTYGDGLVETFVAVPSEPQPFSIRLSSSSFIAPGLAMYVFIDGVYHCNRNRQDLKLRKAPDRHSLVDFCVRQKEEKQKDGSMIAREWRFEKLDLASADDAPHTCSQNVLENIGCIEVVVLRCAGPRTAKSAASPSRVTNDAKPNPMNLDGANDDLDHSFGLDGQSAEHNHPYGGHNYNGRAYLAAGYGTPVQGPGSGYGPAPSSPPPRSLPKTVYSREGTATSSRRLAPSIHGPPAEGIPGPYPRTPWKNKEVAVSGLTNRAGFPSLGYQYGSGPIPQRRQAESTRDFPAASSSAAAPSTPFDPRVLDELLTKAVRRGIEESKRKEASPPLPSEHNAVPADKSRRPPGAFPESPFGPPSPHSTHSEASIRSASEFYSPPSRFSLPQEADAGIQAVPVRETSHATWAQPTRSRTPTQISGVNVWGSPEGSTWDSWDTEEIWEPKDDSCAHSAQTAKSETSRGWQSGDIRSMIESEGWIPVDVPSETNSSWSGTASTIRPQSSISAMISRASTVAPSIKSQRTGPQKKGSAGGQSGDIVPTPTWGGGVPIWGEAQRSDNSAFTPPSAYATTIPGFALGVKGGENNVSWISSSSGSSSKDVGMASGWDDGDATMSNGGCSTTAPAWKVDKEENTAEQNKRGWHSGDGWDARAFPREKKQENNSKSGSRSSKGKKSARQDKKNGPGAVESPWDTTDKSKEKDADVNWKAFKNSWDTYNPEAGTEVPWKDDDAPVDAFNSRAAETDAAGSKKQTNRAGGWNTPRPQDTVPGPWDIVKPTSTPAPASPEAQSKSKSAKQNRPPTPYRPRHPLISSPPTVIPKPHWQFPPPPPPSKASFACDELPEDPPLKLSKGDAEKRGLEHQVRAGKGTQYGHCIGRPEYMDGLDHPYAVFRFKYRSRAALRRMFGPDVIPDSPSAEPEAGAKPSSSAVEVAKEKLKQIPQEQLIDSLVKLQLQMAKQKQKQKYKEKHKHHHKEDKNRKSEKEKGVQEVKDAKDTGEEDNATEIVGRHRTEDWVRQHSRDPSVAAKDKPAKAKTAGSEKKSKDGDGGWGMGDWGEEKKDDDGWGKNGRGAWNGI